jgi:hypothetical protein
VRPTRASGGGAPLPPDCVCSGGGPSQEAQRPSSNVFCAAPRKVTIQASQGIVAAAAKLPNMMARMVGLNMAISGYPKPDKQRRKRELFLGRFGGTRSGLRAGFVPAGAKAPIKTSVWRGFFASAVGHEKPPGGVLKIGQRLLIRFVAARIARLRAPLGPGSRAPAQGVRRPSYPCCSDGGYGYEENGSNPSVAVDRGIRPRL